MGCRGYLVGNGFSRVSRRGHRGSRAGNGRKWQKMAEKWQKMGCRGYLVGNGFSRFLRRGHRGGQEDHGRNGRKWQKKGCRGYLVGNGFPRFLRHSPTTAHSIPSVFSLFYVSFIVCFDMSRVICVIINGK